ncbi:MAG: MFS transporter [Chloroflexota bacterium]
MSRYLIFITVSLSFMLSAMSSTAIAVAFPVITSSLNTTLISAGWVLSIYQLTATAAMPLAGKASDAFGRKFIFLVCISLFTAGSLLCALAPNIQLLILSRLIQGMGSAGFLPSAAGIVSDEFPEARQRMIGLFSSILPIGQIIGPNLGGWLTTAFGWRSIFWFNVPLGVLALVAGALLLRPEPRQKSQLDWLGAALFTGSISALMLGLTRAGTDSTQPWVGLVLFSSLSLLLMIIFVRHERRVTTPLIDRRILRERPFVAANIFNLVFGASVMGIASFIPLYVVTVYGMSIIASGFILTPRAIGMMLAAMVTSVSLMRWGYRQPMLTGTIVLAASLFLLGAGASGTGISIGGTAPLLAIMLLSGLGMGTTSPAANNACIDLMPERVATIIGLRGMFRQTGGALCVSVVTLILHNVGDMAKGFTIVFLGLGGILLLSVPLIFAIPAVPRVYATKETGIES